MPRTGCNIWTPIRHDIPLGFGIPTVKVYGTVHYTGTGENEDCFIRLKGIHTDNGAFSFPGGVEMVVRGRLASDPGALGS